MVFPRVSECMVNVMAWHWGNTNSVIFNCVIKWGDIPVEIVQDPMTVFLSSFLLLLTLLVCHFYTYLLSLAILLCQCRSEYLANSSLPYRALKGKEEARLPQPRSRSGRIPWLCSGYGVASYNPVKTSGTAGLDVGVRGQWLKLSWASPVSARWDIPFGNHSQPVLWLLLRHAQTEVWHENWSQNQNAVVLPISFRSFLLVSLQFFCSLWVVGTWLSINSLCCALVSRGCIRVLKYICFNEWNYFYT